MSVIASFDILFIKNNVYNFSAKSLLYEMRLPLRIVLAQKENR